MRSTKFLNIKGALLDQGQLENYLEKIASEHILQKKSNKDTFPIPRLIENFNQITKTYDTLNLDLKLGIDIHPAGEWLLDNYYAIEQTYKTIKKELSVKKYTNFIGISNGEYKGFARIYLLASQIVAYTDGKIDGKKLKDLLKAYQRKKTLNMDEIWNISIFFNIALIEQIRNVCEKIYFAQIQKYRVESLIERLVDNKDKNKLKYIKNMDNAKLQFSKEPYIEYLSYRLNQYGKKGNPYIRILEDQVSKTGTTVSEIIKKEHFDIAIKKLLIGNCIKSIKEIQRIDFDSVFEEINGVEEILKKDPANVYERMTHKTKEYYRNKIKELSIKLKVSEIYISQKALELSKRNTDNLKKKHIGYYIIDNGIYELKNAIYNQTDGCKVEDIKYTNKQTANSKARKYVSYIIILTSLLDLLISFVMLKKTNNIIITLLFIVFSFIPISEIIIKLIQYLLSKIIKTKLIPKIDFSNGITKQNTTMVIIPTILKSKEDVDEMLEKIEVYYLANKSDNLYFTLLGDCSTSSKEIEKYDEEIIKEGKSKIDELNKKYNLNIFNFIYRKRIWNSKENNFLGWERKRGLISEFNNYLLGKKENTFKYNSFNDSKIPYIKYIITLDSDTNLVLDSAKELVGAMAHILNKPIIDNEKNIVTSGYGIIQPRIGIDIDSSRKTLFTKIYAGMGGVDVYSSASFDLYQDSFGQGNFTGKGIYELEIFTKVLNDAIPNDTVLSHDLLEGIYVRCGFASDIILLDSYPQKYNSYITRTKRWIRGDWQIIKWLFNKVEDKNKNIINNPIDELSKFKILDNLRRSLVEISQAICLIIILFMNKTDSIFFYLIIFLSIFIDLFIDFLNTAIFKKEGIKKQSSFENKLPGLKLSLVRSIINFSTIIYKAYVSISAIAVTINRVFKTKEHLLEWTTADEAEKNSSTDLKSFFKEMKIDVIFGVLLLILAIKKISVLKFLIAFLWIASPFICWYISRKLKEKAEIDELNQEEILEIKDIAKRTWDYFENYINLENNYLPPDNYQESRKQKIVDRTSSTNIGLGLMSVMSAYDLKFIELDKALQLIQAMLKTIYELPKWNGHLYNWYSTKTLLPLKSEYISTVDSGNFVGYLIVLKTFLKEIKDKELRDKYEIDTNLYKISELIKNTNFLKLYNPEISLLSIGFNVEQNKLTDSYYDLLASEARQASLIAIAKKDIPSKHWNSLSRTLTSIDGKKGLVSWSGTSFEYLMPNINIREYKGSILEESCKFMMMSQKKYCNKLQVPWGISEAAYNLKDLNSNYQYKAFGIPWLGLKRGLADDIVVSSYGSILAINKDARDVFRNIKELKKHNAYGKYGLYESIDFTPERMSGNRKYEVVKTFMAHHQALILLSINNLINNNILQERFHKNPEIKAIDILLQEKLPEDVIITKERKEKIEKIKYTGYDTRYIRQVDNLKTDLPDSNVISNENYTVCMNKDGTGFSKYKEILINRYKYTDNYKEGIFFYFKNIKTKKVWESFYKDDDENYKAFFTPDMNEIVVKEDKVECKIKNIVTADDNVEIRNIKIKNLDDKRSQTVEISSVLEPVLSRKEQDYAHKAFNNLFLKYEKIENGVLIKRNDKDRSIYLAVGFFCNNGNVKNIEFEIDKQKLYGRLNTGVPKKIYNSEEFSNKIGLVVNPIISFRRTIKLEKDLIELNFIISVSEDKNQAIEKLEKYKSFENTRRAFEISKTRNDEMNRYLQVTSKEMIVYQKILSYLIMGNPLKKLYIDKLKQIEIKNEDFWKYGISGDLPIILLKINEVNNSYVLQEVLKAYKFFTNKNIAIDLVILNGEANVYERYVKVAIEKKIADQNLSYLINNNIFIINLNEIESKEKFELKASFIVDAQKGNLETVVLEQEDEYLHKYKENKNDADAFTEETEFEKYNIENMDLIFKNSYGGFSKDGREYVICVDSNVPSVWCNVLANENFGTIVSQNLGGYSWYKNSRLSRISKWSNDAVFDTSSECIFIKDVKEKKFWKIGNGNLLATYGFGYSIYEQNKLDIKQKLSVFVSMNDNVKINLLRLKNNTNNTKDIEIIYKIDTVLGEDEIKTDGELTTEFDNDVLYSKSQHSTEIKNISYIYSSEKIDSYTGNYKSINLKKSWDLNKENSFGNKPCMAIKISVNLKAFEEKKISLVLGAESDNNNFKLKYKKIEECENECNNTINYWKNILEKIRIKTPSEQMNIILNGWAMYQTISSRLYARTRFLSIRRCIWI